MTDALPESLYHYTSDETANIFIHSVKSNRECQELRKDFNLCRANPLGKHVDSSYCFDKATKFIDCAQKVSKDERSNCKEKYQSTFNCIKSFENAGFFTWSNCIVQMNEYLQC